MKLNEYIRFNDIDFFVLNGKQRTLYFRELNCRFFINLPDLVFVKSGDAVYLFALDEEKNLCHAPFTSIMKNGNYCPGDGLHIKSNAKGIAEKFPTTMFKTMGISSEFLESIDLYCDDYDDYYYFYKKWEREKSLKLIRII